MTRGNDYIASFEELVGRRLGSGNVRECSDNRMRGRRGEDATAWILENSKCLELLPDLRAQSVGRNHHEESFALSGDENRQHRLGLTRSGGHDDGCGVI